MRWVLIFLLFVASAASAQTAQTRAEAIGEDALQYAARFGVSVDEATRRLRAQQASVAGTDAIAREFADRIAGISIAHAPQYQIVVLLAGSNPVPASMGLHVEHILHLAESL